MTIDRHITQYLESGSVSPMLEASLLDPANRRSLYRHIVNTPVRPFRPLLLRLLEQEIAFREALWAGSARDDDDYFEGIHHCAYLLSRCGDPADTATLWRIQHLNQDIGEIDVGHFVGAGVAETLSFLDAGGDAVSHEIAAYIRNATSHPHAAQWLERWDEGCRASIAGV